MELDKQSTMRNNLQIENVKMIVNGITVLVDFQVIGITNTRGGYP